MANEIEIKLSIAQGDAARLWHALAHHPRDKPVARRLFSAYYDTPDRALWNAGVALRLRRQSGRWIQTVKREGRVHGGLHERAEFETEVAAQLPSFPAMIEAGLGDLIAERKVRDSISVAFTTEFSRSAALMRPDTGTVIEVCLDRGIIAAGERREPICEIELELKAGNPGALFDLALDIAQRLPVRLENRSKAERGYALAGNIKPSPVKASPLRLTPEMSVDDAFVAIAFDCLAHLQANERGLIGGRDPEYLHQARVALRRLRSAFRVFGSAVPKAHFAELPDQLRALGKALGAARNLNVFVTETLTRTGAAAHPGITTVKRRAQSARRRADRAARAAVAIPDYTILLLRLAALLSGRDWTRDQPRPAEAALPLPQFAAGVLSRQHARVKKRGRNLDHLALEELHRLRIEAKRLRYGVDFFHSLAPKKARGYLKTVAELQELLGRFNDDAAAWKLLDTLAAGDNSAEYQQAVGFVRGWSASDAAQTRYGLAERWARFARTRPWW